MYESFYGLREKPFSLLPDPAYLYLSQQHQMAISLLEYSLENKAGFCVLSGLAGMGKTTLLRRLLNELGDDVSIGLITNTHSSFGDLLRWILHAFNLADDSSKTRAEQYKTFIDYLIERYAQNKRTMLIIDEAQNLSAGALEELRMLSNINSEKDLLLQVILVGQPPLRKILQRPELEQFAQRIAADYHLTPLSLEETHAYIRHRICVAGGEADLFTDDACDAVFNRCRGIPRLINLLCDFALVYAYAEEAAVVTGELIEQVASEREMHGALPVFAGKIQRGLKNSAEKKLPVPAVTMPDVIAQVSSRKTINVSPATQPMMNGSGHAKTALAEKTGQAAVDVQPMPDNMACTTITAKEARPSRKATESRTVAMTSAESLVEKVNMLRQVNGTTLLPLVETSSETMLSLVEVDKSRTKPDPADESLEARRNILWGAFNQGGMGTPMNVTGAGHLLSDQKNRVEAYSANPSKETKRLDWLAELPSRDHVPHPIRRFFPAVAVMSLLLLAGLAWGILRPSSEPIFQASPITSQKSPSQAAMELPAKPKISEQRLELNEPSKKSGTAFPARKSGDHPVVSVSKPRPDMTVKRLQRERDAALALSKSAERERQALLEAAAARERALAAEHEAELTQERERVNRLTVAAEKARQEARVAEAAALAEQKRSKLETRSPSAGSTGAAAAKPAEVKQAFQSTEAETTAVENSSEPTLFTANPCKGPSARFLSTCQ